MNHWLLTDFSRNTRFGRLKPCTTMQAKRISTQKTTPSIGADLPRYHPISRDWERLIPIHAPLVACTPTDSEYKPRSNNGDHPRHPTFLRKSGDVSQEPYSLGSDTGFHHARLSIDIPQVPFLHRRALCTRLYSILGGKSSQTTVPFIERRMTNLVEFPVTFIYTSCIFAGIMYSTSNSIFYMR